MTNPLLQFRCPPKLLYAVDERVGLDIKTTRALVARRDLERYYDMVRHALASAALSSAEMALIARAWGDFKFPDSISPVEARGFLMMAVDEYAVDNPAPGVNVKVLRNKLVNLNAAEAYAVLDAVERGES